MKFEITSLLVLLLSGVFSAVHAQFGMGGPPPEEAKLIKGDLKYIKCEVCEKVVAELYYQVGAARDAAPNKKLDEITVIEIMESVCNPKNESAAWLKKIDIVNSLSKGKKYIVLEEQEGQAKCKNECTTIAKSCSNLLDDDIDADELAALLYLNRTDLKKMQVQFLRDVPWFFYRMWSVAVMKIVSAFEWLIQSAVCLDWSSRCSPRRTPLANSYNREDEIFEPLSEKDLEMEKLMASMAEMGLGGQMYNADSLRGMMGGMDGDMDEDELEAMYSQYGGGAGGGYGGMGGDDFGGADDMGYEQPGGDLEF